MDYDLADHSFYLEAERDEQLREALEQEENEQCADAILLEMEVMYMMEMV